MTPEQINPPAMIQAAFDEARALAECRELIARRDEAKGEFKDAILLLGQKFIEARRMMPGRRALNGVETYSDQFKAFVEKTGLSMSTVCGYMSFARKPESLTAHRKRGTRSSRAATHRMKALKEVAQLLAEAPDLATARRVIQEELNESV